MTDHEDNWTAHPIGCDCPWCDEPVTHKELVAESERVITTLMKRQAKLAETIRDQIAYLNKTHTVALMAAELYAASPVVTPADAAHAAKGLYREVQKALESDDTIAGSISA